MPITAKTWDEVDISWYNPFNPKQPNAAQLLRPINYIKQTGLIINRKLFMDLSEFGVPEAKVTVSAIHPIPQQTIDKMYRLSKSTKPIIGVYVHQTDDVRMYHFIDRKGHISIIHATPNHPFYVSSLRAYIPITQITNTMSLTGNHDQKVYLICPPHQYNHCGTAYRPHKVKTVYNLEIYRHHFFRVGEYHIKVHNSEINSRLQNTTNVRLIDFGESGEYTYRWDSRPPSQILTDGFKRSNYYDKTHYNWNLEFSYPNIMKLLKGKSPIFTDPKPNAFKRFVDDSAYLYKINIQGKKVLRLGEILRLPDDNIKKQILLKDGNYAVFESTPNEILLLEDISPERITLGLS